MSERLCKFCGGAVTKPSGFICTVCENQKIRDWKRERKAQKNTVLDYINPERTCQSEVVVEHDPGPYETSLPPRARFSTVEFADMVTAGHINSGVRIVVEERRFRVIGRRLEAV